MKWLAPLFGCAALLGGCTDPLTELVIVVDTDYDVPAEMNRVRIEVASSAMEPIVVTVPLVASRDAAAAGSDAVTLPVTLGIVPDQEVFPEILVTVTGLLESAAAPGTATEVVSKQARVQLAKGHVRELHMDLRRVCERVSCAPGMTTCELGRCRNVDVEPSELLPFTGNPERFVISSDAGVPDGGQPDGGCAFGTAECDGDPTVVCETETQTSRDHCGGCGVSCWGRCIAGVCDGVAQVEAGDAHTCARTIAGDVYCWGDNSVGQVGNGGTATPVARPERVPLAMPATHLAVGGSHGCALLTGGGLVCWGDNSQTQVAGPVSPVTTPTAIPIPGGGGAPAAVGAGGAHSCFIQNVDVIMSVLCWGGNTFGQLGGLAQPNPSPLPGDVVWMMGNGAASIAAGVHHTCAVSVTGTLWCWGDNRAGEIGMGTVTMSPEPPREIPRFTGVLMASAGSRFTCALLDTGRAYCWGSDGQGQLGNGAVAGSLSRPAGVPSLTGVTHISAGTSHACAVDGTGQAYCWGSSRYRQVGQMRPGLFELPLQVSGLPNAVLVAAGGTHSCALTSAGEIVCWGNGRLGQLGRGTAVMDDYMPGPVQRPL